jgi:hypothetical protein
MTRITSSGDEERRRPGQLVDGARPCDVVPGVVMIGEVKRRMRANPLGLRRVRRAAEDGPDHERTRTRSNGSASQATD